MQEEKVFSGHGFEVTGGGGSVNIAIDAKSRFMSSTGKSAMMASTGGKVQIIIDGEIWTLQLSLYRAPTTADIKMMG